MITIDPNIEKTATVHSYLLAAVAPRPIALASTIDSKGHPNLSPFSFFNAFSARPPVLVFSPARRVRDNTTKHTLENVKEVPEVVINVVTYDMVQQASLASTEYPREINEFIKSGFTPERSEVVKPFRVKESPVQFECKVTQVIALGNEGGAGNMIVCEILRIHINENILNESGKIDQNKIDLVARLGGDLYCRASGSSLFEVAKPLTTLGIGIDRLPASVRNSAVLTGNNLGQLGNVESLPDKKHIEAIKHSEHFKALVKKSAGLWKNLEKDVHLEAKALLDQGRVLEAWMLLLAAEN